MRAGRGTEERDSVPQNSKLVKFIQFLDRSRDRAMAASPIDISPAAAGSGVGVAPKSTFHVAVQLAPPGMMVENWLGVLRPVHGRVPWRAVHGRARVVVNHRPMLAPA